jgi:hypothetical protein
VNTIARFEFSISAVIALLNESQDLIVQDQAESILWFHSELLEGLCFEDLQFSDHKTRSMVFL